MDLTKGIPRTLSSSAEYKMFLTSFSKSEQKVDYSHYKREYNYRARKNKDKTFFFFLVISLHFLLPSLFYNHY